MLAYPTSKACVCFSFTLADPFHWIVDSGFWIRIGDCFANCSSCGRGEEVRASMANQLDRGKRQANSITNKNSKIYLDLKDIIRENALPFLPAKSLLRSIAVCREWKLTIKSPFFVHQQSNSFRGISGLFVQPANSPPSFLSLDPMAYGVPDPLLKFLPQPVDILSSSNGLLCCQGREGNKPYYICNPVTQKWKVLPQHNSNHGSNPAIVLIFEPSLLNFMGEYQLVCAFRSELDGYEFEIYSSTNSTWRVSGDILFGGRNIKAKSGIHVNGIVYWQSSRGTVAFDIKNERSTLVNYHLPGTLAGSLNGKLCNACVESKMLRILVLVNPHTNTMANNSMKVGGWEMVHQINLDLYVSVKSVMLYQANRFISVSSDSVVVMQFGNDIWSYDLKTKCEKLVAANVNTSAQLIPYVNSLADVLF